MAVQLLKGPFTVADYYRMAETGILRPDERVELLDGQVVAKVTIGPRHAGCVSHLARLLFLAAGKDADLRVQNPVRLDEHSEPEPDLSLVRPRRDSYRTAHPLPKDTFLVIEVADTTLEFDRDIKLPLYARAGIPEVWLVDLASDQIEVYRQPGSDGYAKVRLARRGDTLAPLHPERVRVLVDDILG